MFAPRSLLASGMLMLTALTAAARAETALTYADLVQRMMDLAHLAVLPQAGEKCRASGGGECPGKAHGSSRGAAHVQARSEKGTVAPWLCAVS